MGVANINMTRPSSFFFFSSFRNKTNKHKADVRDRVKKIKYKLCVFLRSCDGCLTVDKFFFLLFKFAIYLTFSVLDLFDVCDFDLLDLFLSSFYLGLRKVYPYYFTFTTFTKGRWVGEKILDVFAREFRAHPVEEYVSHF